MAVAKVLSIAGSDSGAGAGIQADMKAIAAQGVYAMTAITALTAQNTLGVQGVLPIEPAFVAQQIDSVMMDMGADVWKIGMLANVSIIACVAERARHYGIETLVLDPVMVAKGGDALLAVEAREALIAELIPLATVVTPNHHEAEVLTNLSIRTVEDMKEAARQIVGMGAKAAVVKGGHLSEDQDAIDVLFDGDSFSTFGTTRIATGNTHGTGCSFASALSGRLALGESLQEAVKKTKDYITSAIAGADALAVGNGHGPLDHFLWHR